ncbi:alpha/beta hydrolase [Agathobacter sp.]|uniref:alpha/beta hydrolase n=1 Tax=Agathobacter sp. TaxID=2021311 RepID=UPI003FD7EA9A
MFKTKKNRIPAVYRILLVAIAVIALGGIAVNCYVGNYYHADSIAEAAIDSDREVAVTIEKKAITFAPQDKEKATKALIFYPGGRVQYTAYAPLMHELAKNNFVCILVHMPGNLAVLDKNAADGIIEKYKEMYPSIKEWYIGGHSLGGAMAAEYVSKHADEFDGLFLFAAYSTADLSDSALRVFSVYGSKDGVLDMDKYRKYRANLPEKTYEYVIDGGCHSYFGSYGLQKGDGTPEIAFEEQIEMAVDFITYNSK